MTTRERLIETTLSLLRARGLGATGLNRILAESRAPRGSLYHHFPGGKEQLVIAALEAAGAAIAARIDAALAAPDGRGGALGAFIRDYAETMVASDYTQGCPIGNVAVDAAATAPAVRRACDAIFAAWQARIARALESAGVERDRAPALAEFVLATIEGALILCRTRRSVEPLMRAGERLAALRPAPPRGARARPRRRSGGKATPR